MSCNKEGANALSFGGIKNSTMGQIVLIYIIIADFSIIQICEDFIRFQPPQSLHSALSP